MIAKRKLRKAIDNFEKAVRNHEMKGATPPEEWSEIEFEYRISKEKLMLMIELYIHECIASNRPQ